MPEPIVEVDVKRARDKLRLEWGMSIDAGKWLWDHPHLEVRFYCAPFPATYGNPELIHIGLEHLGTTHTSSGSFRIPIVPVDWSIGKEKSRGAFLAKPVTSDGEGRYFPLYLLLDDIKPGDGAVQYFPVEWPVDEAWLRSDFRWWVDFGFQGRTGFERVARITKTAVTPTPTVTVDPAIAPTVFISYQRDSEPEADRVRTYLQGAGFSVWQDTENIRGTARWPIAINDALHDTQRLVLLLTPDSMQSDEVFNEWFYYYSEKKPIHCLLLAPCDIHYQLRPFQYLDWREPAKRNWAKLAADLLADFVWPSIARHEKVVNTAFAPTRTLPEAMQALHDALLSDNAVVALTDAQLRDIAQHRAEDDTQYRLGRYAAWCGPRYQLDERFVRLTMLLQGDQGWQPHGDTRRFSDLRDVLAEEASHTLVLLGDPGAGKSTVLRRLEMDVASDALREPSQQTLTFFVSLAEYGHGDIPFEDLPTPFEWLSRKWANQCPLLPDLDTLLHERRMLLLLDSLNEMPHTDRDDFERRADLWRTFLYDYIRDRPGNRAVFACRTLDYGAVLSSEPYPIPQVRLEAMTREQVRDYLDSYAPEHADLIWHSLREDPRQFELFRIPFLLRLLVERVKLDGRVPQGRAETFNGFVYSLLRREAVDKKPPAPLFRPDTLLTRRDVDQLRRQVVPHTPYDLPERGLLIPALVSLAHTMQDTAPGEDKGLVAVEYDDALGLIPDAGEHMEDVLNAGCAMSVLDHTDDDFIRYYHQLIQEFFAARKLAREPKPDLVRVEWHVDHVSPTLAETLERIADSDPLPLLPGTGWEETTVMAAAMSADPDAFVRDLIDANLPLAGRCAAAPDVKVSGALRDEIRWALVARTQDPDADLRARIAAGLALGEMGDPRFERHTGPYGAYLLPHMIPIEGGQYTIGSDDGLYDDETPVHTVPLKPFEMAQFPVTNAEYKLFIDADGYEDEQWWDTDAAKAWRRGEGTAEGQKQDRRDLWRTLRDNWTPDEIRSMVPERFTSEQADNYIWFRELNEEELENTLRDWYPEGEVNRQPRYWYDAAYNSLNQPVVGICWYEARAYCAWLSAQTGQTFRLPSEAEWEAAARGKEARRYPYGPDFDVTRSNTFKSHIRRTTPVGVFPGGETPDGLVDMSGNVWDWTSTAYRAYRYSADDGREDPADAAARRVVRGGSWDVIRLRARAAFRYWLVPVARFNSVGFRVVRVPHL